MIAAVEPLGSLAMGWRVSLCENWPLAGTTSVALIVTGRDWIHWYASPAGVTQPGVPTIRFTWSDVNRLLRFAVPEGKAVPGQAMYSVLET